MAVSTHYENKCLENLNNVTSSSTRLPLFDFIAFFDGISSKILEYITMYIIVVVAIDFMEKRHSRNVGVIKAFLVIMSEKNY